MDLRTVQKLKELSQKYETSAFLKNDPSRFLHRYSNACDIEVAGFIAAMLSFGQREQFLKKLDFLFDLADKSCKRISTWILEKHFLKDFLTPDNKDKKFYRFYSFWDLTMLFESIFSILKENKTLGEFFKKKFFENLLSNTGRNDIIEEIYQNKRSRLHLSQIISDEFKDCKIVPHGKNSANKRVNMFLRWMVRQNSSVDVGLWTWYNASDLLIPLDTHVLQEATNLKLISAKTPATFKTAKFLTEQLKEVFPDDPVKCDFALFGLGVTKE